jgi:hypothetical protein
MAARIFFVVADATDASIAGVDNFMRVTIDLDSHNLFLFSLSVCKGILMCRRLPYYFRLTRRGFHIGWRGMSINEKEMYRRRFIIGDDRARIWLDMKSSKRVKQVLFTEKTGRWIYPALKDGVIS